MNERGQFGTPSPVHPTPPHPRAPIDLHTTPSYRVGPEQEMKQRIIIIAIVIITAFND